MYHTHEKPWLVTTNRGFFISYNMGWSKCCKCLFARYLRTYFWKKKNT
jgi:ribosomal protein L37E